MKKLFIFFVFLFIFGCSSVVFEQVEINNAVIDVETVKSSEEIIKGLSLRESLDENKGMLFIFDKPGRYDFWMKDMRFSLDILFISEDLRIIRIIFADPCLGDFCESYSPEEDFRYVLEVNNGFSVDNGVKEGDLVRFRLQ